MKHLKELIARKKAKGDMVDADRAEAKGKVLGDLMSDMSDADAPKVKGIKKVTVASSDASGLEKGLEKAKEIVHSMPSLGKEEENEEEVAEADMDDAEDEELAEMSPDELEAKIRELQDLLKSKKSSHLMA